MIILILIAMDLIFCRNEKTLAGLEKKQGIQVRWQENDATFQNAQQHLCAKKKSDELLRLHKIICRSLQRY